jgi:D-sedoheptulose 7-phosphate isomerase
MIKKILNKEILSLIKTLSLIKKNNFFKSNNFFKVSELCLKSIKNNNKIIFCGNGGSASDSQHLAAELIVRYKKNRKSIPAIALSSDNSIITAAANDLGFKYIFSRQLEGLGKKGDIVICLTTSGNSQNLIEVCKEAKKKEIMSVCFSGNKGGKLIKYADISVIVPSKITSVIQVVELMLGQVLCEYLEIKTIS